MSALSILGRTAAQAAANRGRASCLAFAASQKRFHNLTSKRIVFSSADSMRSYTYEEARDIERSVEEAIANKDPRQSAALLSQSIVKASELSSREVLERISKEISGFRSEMTGRFGAMESTFGALENKVGSLENKIESTFGSLKNKVGALENKIDAVEIKVDGSVNSLDRTGKLLIGIVAVLAGLVTISVVRRWRLPDA